MGSAPRRNTLRGGTRGRRLALVAAGIAIVAAACGSSGGQAKPGADTGASRAKTVSYPIAKLDVPAGAKRIHLEVGPLTVVPGQNSIDFTRRIPQPTEDGWIVGMTTNLRRADGTVPPVDVIHLHHGVWLNVAGRDTTMRGPERFYAAGEEKTAMVLPKGYGYAYKTSDRWILNYMLHNQLSKPDQVWVTYDVDLIPASSAAAKGVVAARPIWMDVQNGSVYPVFDVLQGTGTNGTYTYPDQAADPYGSGPAKNTWTVDADGVLVGTAGHVHPGGLHDDLWLTRAGNDIASGKSKAATRGDTVRLFSSVANYFEPAGNVSWDVSMTATPLSWRPIVHKGDVLSMSTTYDSDRASWYESMGIMVVWMANDTKGGVDPFRTKVDVDGVLTHGHLAENDNHGGKPAAKDYRDLTKLPSRVVAGGTVLPIADFAYVGDMSVTDSVPTITQGESLVFRNDDAPRDIPHTITSCTAPCNRSTGIAYPLADGSVRFDSGELGRGGPPNSGRLTWTTPTDLRPGTYTYFCRIHPYMRGAFRVVAKTG